MPAGIVRRTLLTLALAAVVLGLSVDATARPRKDDTNQLVAVVAATKLPRGLHASDTKQLKKVAALLKAGKRRAALSAYRRALKSNRGRLVRAAKKRGKLDVLPLWVLRRGLAKSSSPIWVRADKIRFYRQQKKALQRHAQLLRRIKKKKTRLSIMRAAPYRFGAAAVITKMESHTKGAQHAADKAGLDAMRAEAQKAMWEQEREKDTRRIRAQKAHIQRLMDMIKEMMKLHDQTTSAVMQMGS